MRPDDDVRVKPLGKLPLDIVYVYGGVPPETLMAATYAEPALGDGIVVEAITRLAAVLDATVAV